MSIFLFIIFIQTIVDIVSPFIYIGNLIGAEGATAIAEALKVNATLTQLDLEGASSIVIFPIFILCSIYLDRTFLAKISP